MANIPSIYSNAPGPYVNPVVSGNQQAILAAAAARLAAQKAVASGNATQQQWNILHPAGGNAGQLKASYDHWRMTQVGFHPGQPGTIGTPATQPVSTAPHAAAVPTHGPGSPGFNALHASEMAARAASGNTSGAAASSGGSSGGSSSGGSTTGMGRAAAPLPAAPSPTTMNSPIISSLISQVPDWNQTSQRIQQLYAPALKSLQDMQNAAVHAATLRSADIASYQDFVTKQAQQAQDLMAKTNTGYTGLTNQASTNVGGALTDAQNIVAANSQLADQSGLAGAVQASGNTLGAAQTSAQGAATTAQAQSAGAIAGQKYAMDMAANERIAAQNQQSNLEVNTFLPKMLEIQQAIPAAVSGLWTTEEQRAIEAGKIAMAGQIAKVNVAGRQNVANTKAASSNYATDVRSETARYVAGQKDATSTTNTWIKANASVSAATIRSGGAGQQSFVKSIANGPNGTSTDWTTFASSDSQSQQQMLAGAFAIAKIQGVPFKVAASALYGHILGTSAQAVFSDPNNQAQYQNTYNAAGA